MKKRRMKEKVFAILLTLCMVLTIWPANTNAAVIGDVEEGILYQERNGTDIRLVAYVDDLELYEKVSFTLTIDGNVSKELVCTTAYDGLYADGKLYKTEEIYKVDGYFVTYVINGYLNAYAGKEVTITVNYVTVEGETIIDERTVTIGTAEEEPYEPVYKTATLTYANGYDWTNTTSQIYAFASSDSTATPISIMGQNSGFMGWWNGVVLEYNSTNGSWQVVSVNWADGTNEAEEATLGDDRLVVIFHSGAATAQADSYNFFVENAVEGAEFKLSTDIATLQAAYGTLTDVTLSWISEEDVVETPIEVPNGLAVYMPSDRPIKIAQFADFHFGTEGANYHNNRTERTKEYMKDLVETQKPDLIVCSGDNIMSSGVSGLAEFVELMESLKTPWTFIFGNHDAEGNYTGYDKVSISNYLETCDAEYLLYDSGYIDTTNNRYGNFSISVLNSTGTEILGAVILLDSGAYNSTVSSYDSLTEGQIAWYKSEIDNLNASYTGNGVIPSVVFAHIQLPEYYDAYQAALANNGAEFIIEQNLTAAQVASVKSGGPTNVNTGFFQAMVDKQSTVAFFCGHEHLFDFQVKMDGIVLGFGPQSGFSTLFSDNDMPRKTHIYNFDKDFEFTTTTYVEKGEGLGLHYTGTYDSIGQYDQTNGTYSTTNNFISGNYIQLSYDGVRLTTENTTITGDFSTSTTSTKQGGFYSADGKTFIYDGISINTCVFTYDPATNTLNISCQLVPIDPNAPTSMTAGSVNSDAGANAIAVWTTAGTKIKYNSDGEETWIGGGWRYYVVVDSEGRIAYAVYQPLSGYGGPANPTYYAHPHYTDYTKNPAINLLDGFATDWASGGTGYNQFEIVVPEGGFAITGHGTANATLVEMLSQGALDSISPAAVNNRGICRSNIRLSYNSTTKTVSLTTVDEENDSTYGSLTYSSLNSDAGGDAFALWTTAGTKLKYNDESTGKENWMADNWRYYVVVDSEGRIAYAVYQPLSGYGGPAGKSYYANPYYTDYTKNPAINLLDGFAQDWGTGTGYTKFEIVVPEGGFAITGHGTANTDIVELLSLGEVTNCDESTVNNRNVYDSNIRVSYDLEKGTISVRTVE